jgi:hypothetical protein
MAASAFHSVPTCNALHQDEHAALFDAHCKHLYAVWMPQTRLRNSKEQDALSHTKVYELLQELIASRKREQKKKQAMRRGKTEREKGRCWLTERGFASSLHFSNAGEIDAEVRGVQWVAPASNMSSGEAASELIRESEKVVKGFYEQRPRLRLCGGWKAQSIKFQTVKRF